MKRLNINTILIPLALILAGCSKDGGGTSGGNIAPAISPVDSISVKCDGKLVETYVFSYDSEGRLATLFRKDESSKTKLLDLKYSYGDGSGMTVTGTMNGKPGSRTLKVNYSSSELSYVTDTWNGWRYSTSIGRDGVARDTRSSSEFNSIGGYFSSATVYAENYELVGKDIAMVEAGTAVESRTIKDIFGTGSTVRPVNIVTSSSLVSTYNYSDAVDRQNFCSFVFNCNFPLWYAAGLPGCEHLVTDVNVSAAGVDIPQHQHFDYTFNEKGDIIRVIRTWSSEGKAYLTLTYDFIYKAI